MCSLKMDKLKKLKDILKNMDSVLIAYSGGLDSTFLLKVASDVLSDEVLAVTAASATYPREELIFAKKIARTIGARHKIIRTAELKNNKFISNPPNRCYFCKKELFSRLKKLARRYKLKFVIDASNASDKNDFRPGNRAKDELNIRSPLQEAGLNKEDIRRLSKNLGLATWNKASLACLASRIPYGSRISQRILGRINQAEVFLKNMGFKQVRIRHYGGLCRIEVLKEDVGRIFDKRDLIIKKLKRLGYNFITVDLQGYRMGSMNEVLNYARGDS
jgi:uncharacterized protein